MLGTIGIGGSLAAPPLPHHRTYGSVYGGSLDEARAIFHASAEGSNSEAHRVGFGPFEQRRPGFTLSRRSKGQIPGIRPLGRYEVSASVRSSSVRAFSEARSAYYAVC